MLRINIPISPEGWDEEKQEFVEPKTVTFQLEHSLVSISKWESKWCKAYLTKREKTKEEALDYVRCMTITQNVDPDVYNHLTRENFEEIQKYIEAPMTATVINTIGGSKGGGKNNETATSELIYYWMMSYNIYPECQKWHLNRLLKLIEVFNAKNAPAKKMSSRDTARSYAAMNAARRRKHNSKG